MQALDEHETRAVRPTCLGTLDGTNMMTAAFSYVAEARALA
jgi:hypothetical protein